VPSGLTNAVAIAGERIIAAGKNSEIRRLIGRRTKVINLRGRTVVPGMIDAHIHFIDYGLSLKRIDLRDAKSIAEIQAKLEPRQRQLRLENGS
jgi:predicted amidohydrolase YtcJ